MIKAVRVHKVGGPEALVYEPVDVPAPAPGEVRIRKSHARLGERHRDFRSANNRGA